METFDFEREEWLRGFLELPNGIPDSDAFRRLFECLNPAELSECLYDWLDMAREERYVVAVDGKTIRGSGNTRTGRITLSVPLLPKIKSHSARLLPYINDS